MYTLLKPIKVREELLKRNIRIFTPEEFRRIFRTPPYTVKYFLEKQAREGLLLRLKNGLYALQTDLPSEEEVANKLYRPSYISFEYALAYYNMIPEMPYQVTCATTKPTRVFSLWEKEYTYTTIKLGAFTGYALAEKNGKRFLIADAEKAYVDYLYFVTLGKRDYNQRMKVKNLNKKKAVNYGLLYRRDSLIKLIFRQL